MGYIKVLCVNNDSAIDYPPSNTPEIGETYEGYLEPILCGCVEWHIKGKSSMMFEPLGWYCTNCNRQLGTYTLATFHKNDFIPLEDTEIKEKLEEEQLEEIYGNI